MKRPASKLLKFSFLLVAFLFLLWLLQRGMELDDNRKSIGITFVKPAFAQEGGVSFLDREAGIAAYTDLSRKIDVTGLRTIFRNVEKETEAYIVGSVPVLGYEAYGREDVHCFIHRDGWIVAYYLKSEPTAKVINWQHLGNNKLKVVLTMACNTAGSGLPYIKYYQFKYPDATGVMLITKRQQNHFRIMIPDSFTIYERSWSTDADSGQYIAIDGESVSDKKSSSGEYGTHGFAAAMQLRLGEFHTIQPSSNKSCAIVIVYGEV